MTGEKLDKELKELHFMACVMAEKWKGDLERNDCSYSVVGLNGQLGLWQDEMNALLDLYANHYGRRKEYMKNNDERRRAGEQE